MLEADDGTRLGVLAERLACEPSNFSHVVRRLEELGYAERRGDDTDRRIGTLALTPAGVDARRRVTEILERAPDWLRSLDVHHQQALLDALEAASRAAADDTPA